MPELAASEIKAGVASDTFVLPKHVPLAGYSRRNGKPSQGVHDPIGVRALILQDDDTTAALVSADVLIVDERLFAAVRDRVRRSELPQPLTLLLAATHTHSGPGAYGAKFFEKLSMGHYDPVVFERLADAMATAVVRAYADRRPVRVAHDAARTEGLVKNRMDPHGLVDDELAVTAFYPEASEEPFAVLVNFSAHPTTLGAWNRYLSADYPGVVVRELEHRFPGATALFFAGAVGDQAPVKSGTGFERAEWVGMALADQAALLLRRMQPTVPREVAAEQEDVALPPAQVRIGRFTLPRWLGRQLVDDDATVSAVAVGNMVFLGVPCDLAAELGVRLKRTAHAHHMHPVIVGFACDYIGYCVSERVYEAKEYESFMAFNGPRAGELVVDRLIQLVGRVVTSDK